MHSKTSPMKFNAFDFLFGRFAFCFFNFIKKHPPSIDITILKGREFTLFHPYLHQKSAFIKSDNGDEPMFIGHSRRWYAERLFIISLSAGEEISLSENICEMPSSSMI